MEQPAEKEKKKQKRLEQHEVWNLEEERSTEQKLLSETEQDYEKKDKAATEKTKQELETKERIDHLNEKIATIENEMEDQLLDLETDASAASFDRHDINVKDFGRRKVEDFDLIV